MEDRTTFAQAKPRRSDPGALAVALVAALFAAIYGAWTISYLIGMLTIGTPEQRTAEAEQTYRGGCDAINEPTGDGALQTVTTISGYNVTASAGVLDCGVPIEGAVVCSARGPGQIFLEGENISVGYSLAPQQFARFTVGPAGATCDLRAEAPRTDSR